MGWRWSGIKAVEKNCHCMALLDDTLSSNYGSCLAFFVQNDLLYESDWTSYGNPREYSLRPSLEELLFNNPEPYREELEKCKQAHMLEMPF